MSHFQPLEVVFPGSETQPEMAGNLNRINHLLHWRHMDDIYDNRGLHTTMHIHTCEIFEIHALSIYI